MLLSLLLLAGLSVHSGLASAAPAPGWTGQWLGEGKIIEDDGNVANCGDMEIELREEKIGDWEDLYVASGLPPCGLPSEFGAAFRLRIRDRSLVYHREAIGELGDRYLRILKYSTSYKELIEIWRDAGDESLVYRKVFTFASSQKNFEIEGTLKKSAP